MKLKRKRKIWRLNVQLESWQRHFSLTQESKIAKNKKTTQKTDELILFKNGQKNPWNQSRLFYGKGKNFIE